ncbi:hypothetical protein [Methylobacterium nodulans]|nr:hypothetical protein [Methylobacterium nodulans]
MGDVNITVESKGSSGNPKMDEANNRNLTAQLEVMMDQKISEWAANAMRPGGMLRKAGARPS